MLMLLKKNLVKVKLDFFVTSVVVVVAGIALLEVSVFFRWRKVLYWVEIILGLEIIWKKKSELERAPSGKCVYICLGDRSIQCRTSIIKTKQENNTIHSKTQITKQHHTNSEEKNTMSRIMNIPNQ